LKFNLKITFSVFTEVREKPAIQATPAPNVTVQPTHTKVQKSIVTQEMVKTGPGGDGTAKTSIETESDVREWFDKNGLEKEKYQ
jgi:hypothetical protein